MPFDANYVVAPVVVGGRDKKVERIAHRLGNDFNSILGMSKPLMEVDIRISVFNEILN